MINIRCLHHIAIICSNYQESKKFYTEVLGLKIIREIHRKERNSYKLDLSLNREFLIELFSFTNAPPRPSYPEARGLRHIAFAVENISECLQNLQLHNIPFEPVRTDEFTQKQFTFIQDPDGLPIEFYEL